MTVSELIKELLNYGMDEEVKVGGIAGSLLNVEGTEQLYFGGLLRDGVLLEIEEES